MLKIFNNINQRNNPILFKKDPLNDFISNGNAQRILKVAIPFLNLYKPTQVVVNVQLGLIKSFLISQDFMSSYAQNTRKENFIKFIEISVVIATIAGSILYPTMTTIASESLSALKISYSLGQSLVRLEGKLAAKQALKLTHSIVYIASLYYAAPEVMMISLISQGLKEWKKSYQDYKKGLWLESCANFVLGSVRMMHAKSYFPEVQKRASLAYRKFLVDNYAIYKANGVGVVPSFNLLESIRRFNFNFIFHAVSWTYDDDIEVSYESIELHSSDQKGKLFYTNFTWVKKRGMSEVSPLLTQYLNCISKETGIRFEKGKIYDAGICYDPILGKEGVWKFKHINHTSLLLSVYFGSEGSDQWFKSTEESIVYTQN